MFNIKITKLFKKDYKSCIKRGSNKEELKFVISLLINKSVLPIRFNDHKLNPSKEYKNCRELHIRPDWLLIYKYDESNNILYLVRTGTHSNLFDK